MRDDINPAIALWEYLSDYLEAELNEDTRTLTIRNTASTGAKAPEIVFRDVRVKTRSTSIGSPNSKLNPGQSFEVQLRVSDLRDELIEIEANVDPESLFRVRRTIGLGTSQIDRLVEWLRTNETFRVFERAKTIVESSPAPNESMTLADIDQIKKAPDELKALFQQFNDEVGSLRFLPDEERPDLIVHAYLKEIAQKLRVLAKAAEEQDVKAMAAATDALREVHNPELEFKSKVHSLNKYLDS